MLSNLCSCIKPLIKTNEGNARDNYVYLGEESFSLITHLLLLIAQQNDTVVLHVLLLILSKDVQYERKRWEIRGKEGEEEWHKRREVKVRAGNMLIRSSLICSFAHLAQIK